MPRIKPGSTTATGPLTITPRAAKAYIGQVRGRASGAASPSASNTRYAQNNVPATPSVSSVSMRTDRPMMTKRMAVASTAPAESAAVRPILRHANAAVITIVAAAPKADGRRAAHALGPSSVNIDATSQ